MVYFFICIVIILVGSQYQSVNSIKISNDGKISVDKSGNFVDQYNRVRILRGFNSVEKSFPWYPSNLRNATQLQYFEDWGFNVVRLGTMWSGVMPKSDLINATYLDIMESIIDQLSEKGIYSLLDMHQDVISSAYDSYDGVPRWLIDSFPQPTIPYPFPLLTPFKNWGEGYLTWAVCEAFQHLYTNSSGSWDAWAQFWQVVAKRWGKRASVLGYELINEPWAGDIYRHPNYILPGDAGRINLQPVYDFLARSIRQVDPETIIFYEPVTWAVFFSGNGSYGLGFEHVPGGVEYKNKSALSYHYYCWILQTGSPEKPYPYWERVVCDAILLKKMFNAVTQDAIKLGGGKFLTEFGECAPDNNSMSINTVECEEVLKQADTNLLSWSYWDSQFFFPNGSIDWSTVLVFSRPYPRATAGQPITIKFNVTSGEFYYQYVIDNSINLPTEIFLPMKTHYASNGCRISIQPDLKSSLIGSVLNIFPVAVKGGKLIKNGSIVEVRVTKA